MLIVIAALALVFVPPSPPSVAEFAPQAQDTIEEAPNQQSSRFGGGAGGACALGQVCDDEASSQLPPTKRTVIDKARVRRCVGDPPRQIEDPQSPPCVQFFEGDNGGATWKGVARDEIRVAFPNACPVTDCAVIRELMVSFLNKRFQFYGRTLRLIPFAVGGGYERAEVQRSLAVRADEELKVFGSLPYHNTISADGPYFDELARRQLVGVSSYYSVRTERDDYSPRQPFQWNFHPALDEIQVDLAEWVCKWLVGRNADYATADLNTKQRRFGLLTERESSGTPTTSFLRDGLTRCSTDLKVAEFGPNSDPIQERGIMADFQTSGVTTLACFCQSYGRAMNAAQSLGGFHPEWLLSAGETQQNEQEPKGGAWPTEQRIRMFGLNLRNPWNPLGDSPWWWAVREADPSYEPGRVSGVSGSSLVFVRPMYEALLLLASGIQMAGPHLTPYTFQKGVVEAVFPNPGAGEPPLYQAKVDFDSNDHTMVDDTGLLWWSDSAPSYASSTPTGGFCYVGRGIRFQRGAYPESPMPFFDQATCR